jgi:peptide/nickel transport system substrate-binding protein
MSFDKDRLIKDVRYNTVTRTLSHLNSGHWAYNSDIKDPGYNPKKAAEMLDAAGWKKGPDGIREKDGVKMSFNFTTTAGDKAREQGQLIFQQNLSEIGVEAKIKNLVPPVMWGDHFFKGQFDMIFIGFPLVLGTDPDIGREFYMAKERFGCYTDEEIVKLTELGVTTVGKEARKKIYHRWAELFLDECCFSPLFTANKIYAKKKDLGGYETNPYNTDVTSFIQEWYWK